MSDKEDGPRLYRLSRLVGGRFENSNEPLLYRSNILAEGTIAAQLQRLEVAIASVRDKGYPCVEIDT